MKDLTLVVHGEIEECEEKELSEQDEAVGDMGGLEETGEKRSKELLALKLRSIAMSASSSVVVDV